MTALAKALKEREELNKKAAAGEKPPAGTNNDKEATDMAKAGGKAAKPEMAAKKSWSFDIQHDQEVPAVQRAGRRLPFEFDKMKVGSMFTVPKEFWLEFLGLTKEQAGNPARNKEAIRRSFYNWRSAEKAREKFALAFSDQYDPKSKEYTGVNVYMTNAQSKAA